MFSTWTDWVARVVKMSGTSFSSSMHVYSMPTYSPAMCTKEIGSSVRLWA